MDEWPVVRGVISADGSGPLVLVLRGETAVWLATNRRSELVSCRSQLQMFLVIEASCAPGVGQADSALATGTDKSLWHLNEKRGTVETDRPGMEIDREYRDVVEYLIDSAGWGYKLPTGGGYPRLLPADNTKAPIKVPKTGHTRGHRFQNWIAEVRRADGHWPPGRP
jgi:hypothetical protein